MSADNIIIMLFIYLCSFAVVIFVTDYRYKKEQKKVKQLEEESKDLSKQCISLLQENAELKERLKGADT